MGPTLRVRNEIKGPQTVVLGDLFGDDILSTYVGIIVNLTNCKDPNINNQYRMERRIF